VTFLVIAIFIAGFLSGSYVWGSGTYTTISSSGIDIPGFVNATEYWWGSHNRTDVLAYPKQVASYIIFRQGDTIYAKNGSTGAIEFSGIDASQVIQSAINSLSEGTVFLKPATYVIDNPIYLKWGVNLISCFVGYSVQLKINSDVYGIIVNEGHCSIQGISIIVNAEPYTKSAILVNASSGTVVNVLIKDVYIYRSKVDYGYDGAGILIYNRLEGYGISFVRVQGAYVIGGFRYGIVINATDAGDGGAWAWVNGNEIISSIVEGTEYGFYITNSGDAVTNNNMLTDCKMQASDSVYGVTKEGFHIEGKGNTLVNCKVWDIAQEWWAIHICSDAQYTELIGCRFVNIWDEGTSTLQLTAYGFEGEAYMIVKGHPDTSNWDANMTGAIWYDTTYNCIAYWNGTHVLYLNGSITPP